MEIKTIEFIGGKKKKYCTFAMESVCMRLIAFWDNLS